jgi:hypothetical protein
MFSTSDAGQRMAPSFTTFSGELPIPATMDLVFAAFGDQPPGD